MHHSFHWSPISLVPPTHWSPISLVPHLIGPLLIGAPFHKSPTTLFELIGPPSHWSPFSLVHPFSAHPNGPPSHWSPISLVPHPIGPFSPAGPPIHKSPPHCLNSMAPFSLVPPCNPFYPVLIGPPMRPWLHSSHWSPISLVPPCNPGYRVLIGPPSHWSPNVTLSTLFSLVPHLIGPPNVTLVIQFSLVSHLIGPPV